MADFSPVPRNGVLTKVGFGVEVTAGTPVTPTLFVEAQSEEIVDGPQVENQQGMTGVRSNHEGSTFIATYASGGPFTANARSTILGAFLQYGLGAATGNATLTLPSLTAAVGKASSKTLTVAGCKVATLSLSSSGNAPLVINPTLAGLTASWADADTYAAEYPDLTESIITHSDISMTVDGDDLPIYEFGLEVDNAIDTENYTNSQYRQSLEEIDRMVNLSFTCPWNNDTRGILDAFISKVSQAIVVTLGTAKIITMSNVVYNGETPTMSGREAQRASFTGMAMITGALSAGSEGGEIVLSNP